MVYNFHAFGVEGRTLNGVGTISMVDLCSWFIQVLPIRNGHKGLPQFSFILVHKIHDS